MSPEPASSESKLLSQALGRALRFPAALTLVYGLVLFGYERVAGSQGLITPNGSVSVGAAVLGIAVLGLRLIVLFVLPALVVYRLVLVVHAARRR